MNKFKNIIGIDIAKFTFDASKMDSENPNRHEHRVFEQNEKGLKEFTAWIDPGKTKQEEVLICMEHTGLYINGIIDYLKSFKFLVWVEMPLRIKKSMGLRRNSNDKLDSAHIMMYAYRYQDLATAWVTEDYFIQKLRYFTAQRSRLINSLNQLEVPVNEIKEVGLDELYKQMNKMQAQPIKAIKKAIQTIEEHIQKLIKENQEANAIITQVSSLKGVSTQTAINLFVYTKGFKTFYSAKQLASYCGVVPFEKSSGISVRTKPRVSQFANKNMKRLLHMCAMSAVQYDPELKAYYLRKVLDGKNKMSVLNAVRNKLILRIFAVVRDGRNWVENYQRKCA